MNPRHISFLSNDPNHFNPLTPSHFLIGKTITAPLDPEISHITMN